MPSVSPKSKTWASEDYKNKILQQPLVLKHGKPTRRKNVGQEIRPELNLRPFSDSFSPGTYRDLPQSVYVPVK